MLVGVYYIRFIISVVLDKLGFSFARVYYNS